MSKPLTIEARLIDYVSKNIDKMALNIKGFAKTAGKNFADVGKGVSGVYEKLDQTLKGRGGFLGDLAKFAGLSKLMNVLEDSLGKVFESAVKGSPELADKLEKIKGQINQLVTEAANKLLPVFIAVFDFLLENWDKVRFVMNLVIGTAKDLFALFGLGLQTITLGFKGFILGVTGILNKLGIVNDDTFEKMSGDVEAYGMKVAESADQLKIFGNVRDTIGKGVAGQGKAPKANIDIFADGKEAKNTDVDMSAIYKKQADALKANQEEQKKILDEEAKRAEEVANFKTKVFKDSEMLKLNALADGVNKDLELSKYKFENLRKDLENDKMFAVLSKQEQINAINAIEMAGAEERKRILEDETKARLEKQAEVVDNIARSYDVAGKAVMAFGFDSAESITKSADKQTKAVDKQLSRGLITQEQAEAQKQKILDQSAKKQKERAEMEQDIARVSALINTAQAITAALAHYDPVGAILAGVVGATQVASIEAQGFQDGGLIPGRNTLINTNEDGRPEFVVNADAVSRVGVDTLNNLNNGGGFSGGGTTIINNENNFAPSHTFNGGNAPATLRETLNANAKDFFEWFEEAQKKGYGKGVKGRGR